MRDCQRCSGEVSWTSDTVTLAGGVTACLCDPCQTEWDRLFKDHPIHQEIIRIGAREEHFNHLALAKTPPPEVEVLALHEERARISRSLHDLGREFIRPITDLARQNADRAERRKSAGVAAEDD